MAKRSNGEEIKDGAPAPEPTPEAGTPGGITGRFADLARIAAMLPSAYPTGAPINESVLRTVPGSKSEIVRYPFNAPGVLALEWAPTIGVSRTASSPANLAWSEIASFIKSKVNRRPIWETPDLAIMCMAVDSLISLHLAGQRVYGLINQYEALNKYYPESIIRAAGFNFNDVRNNQLQMLFKLNQRAAELSRYRLPGTFKLFARHMDYNTKVFLDGETVKCQMYVPKQKYYWSYEKVDTVQGLTPVDLPDDCTVDQYFEVYDQLLQALRYSTDVDQIMGDVINAYGDAAVGLMPVTGADYVTPIGYSRDFMITINNAVVLNVDKDTLRIVDGGGGVIKCEPSHNYGVAVSDAADENFVLGNVEYLNFHEDVPTTEDVMSAMLWHPWITDVKLVDVNEGDGVIPDGATAYRVAQCGTELLLGMKMYVHYEGSGVFDYVPDPENKNTGVLVAGGNTLSTTVHQCWNTTTSGNLGDAYLGISEFLFALPYYAQFKSAPSLRIVTPAHTAGKNASITSSQCMQNTQNRVPIDETNLYQAAQALLYDAFFG